MSAIQWFENPAFDMPALKSPMPCIHGAGCVYTVKDANGAVMPGVCRYVHPGEEGRGRALFPERQRPGGRGKIIQPACVRLIGGAGFYERMRLRMPWQAWCAMKGIPFTPNKPGVLREPVKRVPILVTGNRATRLLPVEVVTPGASEDNYYDNCDHCGKAVEDCPERGDHGDEIRDWAYAASL